ncbi:DsrE family protein [Sphingobium sp. CR28]|uniref:DsrE family protein n=1 Tax=Sphingobium sp. CR28 TaxID=3400272 RepID=UPI003FF139EE
MSGRPPLAMIVATDDAERLRAALMLARCEIALGGSARLFAQGRAVRLLTQGEEQPEDASWIAAGEAALADLLSEALEDGVAVVACQSGLALAAVSAQQLEPRIAIGGMIGFLADLTQEARLLFT